MHHLLCMRHLAWIVLLGTLLSGCLTISRFERGRLKPAPIPVTEVAFEQVKGLIVLEATVNGVKGRFLLDNGFSLSALNPGFAARAGIRFRGSVKLVDANKKSTQTGEATVDNVVIGQHTFLRTGFYAIDTRRFFPCDSLDGVIGASIINKINWQIDFNTQRLRLSPEPFAASGQALAIDGHTERMS
ncbi:MAG: retropepsin-like aspartic protease [Bacteroidota bacterium]